MSQNVCRRCGTMDQPIIVDVTDAEKPWKKFSCVLCVSKWLHVNAGHIQTYVQDGFELTAYYFPERVIYFAMLGLDVKEADILDMVRDCHTHADHPNGIYAQTPKKPGESVLYSMAMTKCTLSGNNLYFAEITCDNSLNMGLTGRDVPCERCKTHGLTYEIRFDTLGDEKEKVSKHNISEYERRFEDTGHGEQYSAIKFLLLSGEKTKCLCRPCCRDVFAAFEKVTERYSLVFE